MTKADSRQVRRERRSPAEWVAFAISASILLAVVGAIATLWARDEGRPAEVRVQISQRRQVGDRYAVRATVSNAGDRTAASVQVIAELSRSGEVVEDGEQLIDFLAGGASADVEFVFTEDPTRGELIVRPASYTRP